MCTCILIPNMKITLSMCNLFYCVLLISSLTPKTKQKQNARKQDIMFQSIGTFCQKTDGAGITYINPYAAGGKFCYYKMMQKTFKND